MWNLINTKKAEGYREQLLEMQDRVEAETGELSDADVHAAKKIIRGHVFGKRSRDQIISMSNAEKYASLCELIGRPLRDPQQDRFLRKTCGLDIDESSPLTSQMTRNSSIKQADIYHVAQCALMGANASLDWWSNQRDRFFSIGPVQSFCETKMLESAQFMYGIHSEKYADFENNFLEEKRKKEKNNANNLSKTDEYEKSECEFHPSFERGQARDKLHAMIGLGQVKRHFEVWAATVECQKDDGLSQKMAMHCILSGNPGTGKTSVARLIGSYLRDQGLLKRGHVVEVSGKDLIGSYVGQTAPKTNRIIEEALDGVLFIDEAHVLAKDDEHGSFNSYSKEALIEISTAMENQRDKLCVIFATYPEKVPALLKADAGMERRISAQLVFEDYSDSELELILEKMSKEMNVSIEKELASHVAKSIGRRRGGEGFGNAGFVRLALERAYGNRAVRLRNNDFTGLYRHSGVRDFLHEDFLLKPDGFGDVLPDTSAGARAENQGFLRREAFARDEAASRLNDMVGLDAIKSKLKQFVCHQVVNRLEVDSNANTFNLMFLGNPGTGKTTVARLVASLLRDAECLDSGHVIEVSRETLISGGINANARTQAAIRSALGGVLFIDEVHTLTRDFVGRQVIQQIMLAMENYRGKLGIIMATYPEEYADLKELDAGFERRVSAEVIFEDYNDSQLGELLKSLADQRFIPIGPNLVARVAKKIGVQRGVRGFGNAGQVRKVFEQALMRRSVRIQPLYANQKSNNQFEPKIFPKFIASDFGID